MREDGDRKISGTLRHTTTTTPPSSLPCKGTVAVREHALGGNYWRVDWVQVVVMLLLTLNRYLRGI